MLENFLLNGTVDMTAANLFICTACSAVLGVCLAAVHRYKNSASRSFLMTLILLPVIVQMVIMLVNGNLGAGVAGMGAFSLVRFRSMPGSAREITSVFAAMAIGLATGMGYLGAAAFLTAAVSGLTLLFLAIPAEDDRMLKKALKVTIPENLEYAGIFDDIFKEYTRKASLVRAKTVNMGSLYELEYEILLKKQEKEKEMLDAVRCRNGNLTVSCARLAEREDGVL